MSPLKMVGMLLLVGGILALMFGGFSYTKETHDVDLGPLEIEVEDKEEVNVPMWAGIAAVAVGAMIILYGRRL
jgi:hypothetical protein